MIWINKRKPSPELNKAVREAKKTANWKQIVQDNNVSLARKTFDGLHKDIIQSSLYAEQHGLCAYCMRKLHDPDDVIIEHIQPLSTHIDQALNYRNWAGVCDGGQKSPDSRKILCCDASKHNQEIHINDSPDISPDFGFKNKCAFPKAGLKVKSPLFLPIYRAS